MKRSKISGLSMENSIAGFFNFLALLTVFLFLERRMSSRLWPHSILRFSQNFSFINILGLKSFKKLVR